MPLFVVKILLIARDVIGMHYDTFGFIKIDQEEAKNKFSTQGKQLTLLQIGETISK
jgi:L-ascorbate metabolism protein UlaG (beta-lactamase superfamily)